MISQQSQTDTITLTVTNQVGSAQQVELLPNEGVFAGKSSNCRLQLSGEELSDIHCRIELENGQVSVQDWMSVTGTQVNGETITAKTQLQPSDVVQIGQHRIQLGAGPGGAKGNDFDSPSTEYDADFPVVDPAPMPVEDPVSASEDESLEGELADHTPQADSGFAPLEHASTVDSEAVDIDADFFGFEEEETYDRETVALLQAEIEDLQAALAQRDAEQYNHTGAPEPGESDAAEEASDGTLQRMQELIDEANRSDERVAILEEMLFAAEATSRSEQEERGQLEAWVGDIEKRIGQREDEHKAEIEALHERLKESSSQQDRLHKQLLQAGGGGRAPQGYEETVENLQSLNSELQEKLAESEKCRMTLERRLEQQREDQERALRDERVNLAQEKAKISRMRYELSNKLSDIEEIPKNTNHVDNETAHKIRTLREHLREIHEQEKEEAKNASIATRLSKLWKRVEY